MKVRPIIKEDYGLLLELDKKAYPTNSPVTKHILSKWYFRHPELGLVYEDSEGVVGICVCVALNLKGWEGLVRGDLLESDLGEDFLFDNKRDKELGIHVYPIEKLDKHIKNFYLRCLEDISSIVEKLKKENKELRLVGFSGLCTSRAGIGLFEERLGCRERGFVCSENILEKNGKRFVVDSKVVEERVKEGYKYLNRCKMLVTYPGENSLVWKFL